MEYVTGIMAVVVGILVGGMLYSWGSATIARRRNKEAFRTTFNTRDMDCKIIRLKQGHPFFLYLKKFNEEHPIESDTKVVWHEDPPPRWDCEAEKFQAKLRETQRGEGGDA